MTPDQRTRLFQQIVSTVERRFYDPSFHGLDWPALARSYLDEIAHCGSDASFESRVDDILSALKAFPARFYHQSAAKMPLQKAIGATVRPVAHGWMLQDVWFDGAASAAGLEPGDTVREIDGEAVGKSPPKVSASLASHKLSVTKRDGQESRLELTRRTPSGFVTRAQPDADVGYVRVTMFPGLVGMDVAREIDAAVSALATCRALIVDLRGNPGGGSGNLRLMGYLTPERKPVGYSLTRPRAQSGYRREDLAQFRRIPNRKATLLWLALRFAFVDNSIVVVTEGLPKQRFYGRVVMLVNEHTISGAEIVAAFAKDHKLAILVGSTTAGKLLGWSEYSLKQDYRLVIPVSNYLTWEGKCFEGIGVTPDVEIDFSEGAARQGIDVQMEKALEVARSL